MTLHALFHPITVWDDPDDDERLSALASNPTPTKLAPSTRSITASPRSVPPLEGENSAGYAMPNTIRADLSESRLESALMKRLWAGVVVAMLAGGAFTIASPGAHAVDTAITISTTSIDFGDVNVGNTSPSMQVTLTNSGGVPFGPINMFGGAPPTPEFNASQNCQGVTLAPGGSCSVSYTFSPTGPGVFNDTSSFTISATSSQADGEDFTVSLTGTGVNPITATPTTHDFGNVNVGTTSPPLATVITNTSPDESFGPINMFGGAPPTPEFNASQNCQGVTLAPGGSCSVSYTFSPTGTGFFSDTSNFTISATSSQAAGVNFVVSLVGCGVDVGSPCPPAPTTTTVTSSANPSVFGQAVTLTAIVDASPTPSVPTGTLTFVDTSTATTLGAVVLNGSGQAALTTTALAAGSHAIQANYTPDSASFAASSGSLTQVVNAATTTLAFSSSPNPSTFGQSVTFTAAVTAASPSTATPTGTVTFVDLTTATTLGTGIVNSPATLAIDSLAAGDHVIRATFTPSSGNFGSSSAELTQTVIGPTSANTASGSPSGLAFTGSSTPRVLGLLGLALIAAGVLLVALKRRLA